MVGRGRGPARKVRGGFRGPTGAASEQPTHGAPCIRPLPAELHRAGPGARGDNRPTGSPGQQPHPPLTADVRDTAAPLGSGCDERPGVFQNRRSRSTDLPTSAHECRKQIDENLTKLPSLYELCVGPRPQHWGGSGGFSSSIRALRQGSRGQRRSAAAAAFSAGTPERRPAKARAVRGPPAATRGSNASRSLMTAPSTPNSPSGQFLTPSSRLASAFPPSPDHLFR